MGSETKLHRDGNSLVLSGPLNRDAAIGLWSEIQAQSKSNGVCQLNLAGIKQLDSTGVALLAEVMERIRVQGGSVPTIVAPPAGLKELLAAYRMSSDLQFQP
ncbi:STAS domain-containing protein [Xylella fastidiosa]|uniref:Sulfate transporter n=1 Tax=Xylella fastidiosa subsp. sandyi Ann-1 TaxID=155920 RepID=A0A060H3J9_XYLFS|nr:lipid asymmetry maintenance protein MlaB [Xylella fastidiosa]AIC10158.1 sulfate transporter [Xylella fastidiosa subsp. sandyi Ann-1]UIX82083.1 lipid asymmetry maintenance protein MlaB [Xylella fastidiosa subsp. sandyi]